MAKNYAQLTDDELMDGFVRGEPAAFEELVLRYKNPLYQYILALVADESAEYMKKVGALVDQRMDRIQETLHVSQADAAVLAAVNLADELLKNQAAAENLRRQVKNYLDEATQAKNEASELRRQLFKAQQGRGQ